MEHPMSLAIRPYSSRGSRVIGGGEMGRTGAGSMEVP
jgi:hypothetical protein